MGNTVLVLETHLGQGEAEKIESPLGVSETAWLISLPWTSYIFFGGPKAMQCDVSRLDSKEMENE